MTALPNAPLTAEDYAARIKANAPDIGEPALDLLSQSYAADWLMGTEHARPIVTDKSTRLSVEQGAIINRVLRLLNARRTLEIGFGYGFASLWILDALVGHEKSLHTAIDPYEKTASHGIGLKQIEQLNVGDKFRWINDHSIPTMAKLLTVGEKFDFIFIDGNRRFDDVITDFHLADQLLDINGVIALDDMWMPAVKKAAQFIVSNRSYQTIPQDAANMLVLQKARRDERKWDHFVDF